MTRTVGIVQARTGSTRLPGKVLKPLGGDTALFQVLRRVAAIPALESVVCATSDRPEDDVIATEAKRCGAEVYRGSLDDVLTRYLGAAKMANADVILRVTSDCPLIDPDVCGEVIALRASSDADFATNNTPPGFPVGLDCETFTLDALERAERDAKDTIEREHVTPWLRTNSDVRHANLDGPGGRFVEQRWTLDYPEDYAFFAALFDALPPPPEIPGWRDVFATVMGDAELSRLQERCRRVAVEHQQNASEGRLENAQEA